MLVILLSKGMSQLSPAIPPNAGFHFRNSPGADQKSSMIGDCGVKKVSCSQSGRMIKRVLEPLFYY
jgi:hypothetical protein